MAQNINHNEELPDIPSLYIEEPYSCVVKFNFIDKMCSYCLMLIEIYFLIIIVKQLHIISIIFNNLIYFQRKDREKSPFTSMLTLSICSLLLERLSGFKN